MLAFFSNERRPGAKGSAFSPLPAYWRKKWNDCRKGHSFSRSSDDRGRTLANDFFSLPLLSDVPLSSFFAANALSPSNPDSQYTFPSSRNNQVSNALVKLNLIAMNRRSACLALLALICSANGKEDWSRFGERDCLGRCFRARDEDDDDARDDSFSFSSAAVFSFFLPA
jgi:hypothetical protein